MTNNYFKTVIEDLLMSFIIINVKGFLVESCHLVKKGPCLSEVSMQMVVRQAAVALKDEYL